MAFRTCQIRCLLIVAAAALSGCGPSWEADAGGVGTGYDVYRPEPYLMVVEAAAEQHRAPSTQAATQPVTRQITAKIVWLPDYSTRYRIRSLSSGADIWIKDGWELSSLSDSGSGSATLAAVAGLGGQAGSAGSDVLSVLSLLGGQPISAQGSLYPATMPTANRPLAQRGVALYKIIYNREGHVTGLVRIEPADEEPQHSAHLADHNPPPVPFAKPERQ